MREFIVGDRRISAVVMDIRMPGMSGLRAAKLTGRIEAWAVCLRAA